MFKKREIVRYGLVGMICIVLISLLFVLRVGITGFAVFEDSASNFEGIYTNTFLNNTFIQLNISEGFISGNYTSEIFNSGSAQWNNISWTQGGPYNIDLPDNNGIETEWLNGNADMTGNVLLMHLDESSGAIHDFSGEGNNGTNYGATYRSQGIFDSGMSFDGDNDYIQIPYDSSLTPLNAMTIELWMYWNGEAGATDDIQTIVENGDYRRVLRVTEPDHWNGGSQILSFFNIGGNKYVYSNTKIQTNTWYHVATTYDGTSLAVYINGKYDNSLPASGVIRGPTVDVFIGNEETEYFYNGLIDEVAIYSQALSSQEILNNYKRGALRLNLSARSCDDSACSGEDWEDVIDDSPQNLFLNNNQYFQYKFDFESLNESVTPELYSVSIDYTTLDTTSPDIFIVSPQNFSYNLDSILVNISSDGDFIWFYNGSENITYAEGYYNFIEGDNLLIAYANDSSGNENSTNLFFYIDSVLPVISIDSPQEGTTYGYNESIELNYSVLDNNLQSCWYNIDSGENISLISCANTSFDVSGDGSYVINLYANDSLGNENFDIKNFNVDVGAPTIILDFPINTYLNYHDNIQFNYTPSDLDLDICELWGDFDRTFKLNQTDDNPDNNVINTFILDLGDGEYLWNIRCNDTNGESAFNGNKTFYVDTTNPFINLIEPSGVKTSRSITASWTISEANLDNCWYNVYRGASVEVVNSSVNCYLNSTSFSVTVDADFTFNFYANDSAGNQNSKSSSFSVSISIPSTPPSSGGSEGGGGGGGSSFPQLNKTGKIKLSQIENIIARQGDKKTISLNVENTGKIFLNNCKLLVKGTIESWIYLDEIKGIAPGENTNFVFNVNVPEEIESGNYEGELEVVCNEANEKQNIKISIPGGLGLIQINEIKQEKQGLNVSYTLDNSKLIGDMVSVEIWILNDDEAEISRFIDEFEINIQGPIKRNVLIDIPSDSTGIYSVYFAISSDLDEFTRQSIVLGKSSATGMAVFDTTTGKALSYGIFILIIGIGIFFIIKSHGKKDDKKKNHWLLRKRVKVRRK